MNPTNEDMETARTLWRDEYITEDDAIRAIAAALAERREKDAGICDKRRNEEKAVADKSLYPSDRKMHLHGARVADRLAAAIRAGSAPETEFAWLIEAGDPPHYWNGRSPGSYTSDANDAVRFARFEDAERVRLWLITSGKHWKSVQHGFPNTPAAPAG